MWYGKTSFLYKKPSGIWEKEEVKYQIKEITSEVGTVFKLHAFSLLEDYFSWIRVTTLNAIMFKWKCLYFENLITEQLQIFSNICSCFITFRGFLAHKPQSLFLWCKTSHGILSVISGYSVQDRLWNTGMSPAGHHEGAWGCSTSWILGGAEDPFHLNYFIFLFFFPSFSFSVFSTVLVSLIYFILVWQIRMHSPGSDLTSPGF